MAEFGAFPHPRSCFSWTVLFAGDTLAYILSISNIMGGLEGADRFVDADVEGGLATTSSGCCILFTCTHVIESLRLSLFSAILFVFALLVSLINISCCCCCCCCCCCRHNQYTQLINAFFCSCDCCYSFVCCCFFSSFFLT